MQNALPIIEIDEFEPDEGEVYDPRIWEDQQEHRARVLMIVQFLEQAAQAPTFEDAGRPLSDAVAYFRGSFRVRNGAERLPLDDEDLDRLLERLDWVRAQFQSWGRVPYAEAIQDGLVALAEQFICWAGQTVDTPPLDINQRVKVLRNAALNVALIKEINERVHARRNSRVVSFLEYRNARQYS